VQRRAVAMVCQRCKKNTATVHLTEIVKNEKREKHLCEKCAVQEGLAVKAPVPINELLASFVAEQAGARELAKLTCPQCGMSFLEFRNRGLLGCPGDYDAFAKVLVPLLERAQEGASQHVGKVPARSGAGPKKQQELMRLRRELAEAVEKENYELAATLRDQIKALDA
jgi:protein arginine kinase activator